MPNLSKKVGMAPAHASGRSGRTSKKRHHRRGRKK